MRKSKIGIIGGGNMSLAIVAGMVDSGINANGLMVCDRNPEKCAILQQKYGVEVTNTVDALLQQSEVVILAVKPQAMKSLAQQIQQSDVMLTDKLWISVAAGIRCDFLDSALGKGAAIIRAMPNTPAKIRAGVTALYANTQAVPSKKVATKIFESVGKVVWLEDESLMDPVTALSGSGPAYVFLFIEALITAGVNAGLSPEIAQILAQQTVLGAAQLAEGNDVQSLRAQVTSKAGTTEQGIACLQSGGLETLVDKAVAAATMRAQELSDK